jgi:CheY-like chemotaxis protein
MPNIREVGVAHILLVDDDDGVRRSLGAFLGACGYDVSVAVNGVEALAAIRQAAPDVVVTDINMPDMDGIEIVVALRQAAFDGGVIAMSGGGLFEQSMLLDSAAALGADATFEKPVDPGELRETIDKLIARGAEKGRGS